MKTTLTYKQQKEKEISKYESDISNAKFFGATLIVVGFFFAVLPNFTGFGDKMNLFGDYVGGVVSCLWSLAGMAFIYVAYSGQRIQIVHQQIEIDNNQIEFRQQRFETTFFNLLQSHNQIESLIDFRKGDGSVISVGKDCFRTFYGQFNDKILKVRRDHYETVNPNGEKNKIMRQFTLDIEFKNVLISPLQIADCFETFYGVRQGDLAHYFRSLFSLFEYVIKGDESIDKNSYMKIILAQLSSYQNIFLFHYGLMKNHETEKEIIEKNGLLRYLDNSLMIESIHRTLYEPSSSFHAIQ